jgi:predicted O-methyltransferase YrrM
MIAQAFNLVALVPKRPREALERLFAAAEARWEAYDSPSIQYDACALADALRIVGTAININLFNFLVEPQLAGLEDAIRASWHDVCLSGPFRAAHNADVGLARLCYCITRAVRPKTVVETGVCYGVTSSFILQALHCNSEGHLHSVDLPPLHHDADRFVGRFIPESLRSRWTLHRGSSRRLLAPLVKSLGNVDLFIHDSLHTYRNMTMEMNLAWHSMRPGGVLIADDVQANRAFQDLAESARTACSVVFNEKQKAALCGLMVKPS